MGKLAAMIEWPVVVVPFAILEEISSWPSCTALEAKLWGIYHGIYLARRKGIKGLITETDASMVVDLLTSNNFHTHALHHLLRGILDIGIEDACFNWRKIDREKS